MLNNFTKLLNFLKIPKKFVLYFILIAFLGSSLEILGLTTLYALLTNIQSENINNYDLIEKFFVFETKQEYMIFIIILFCILFIIKNLTIMYLNYFTYTNLQKIKNNT